MSLNELERIGTVVEVLGGTRFRVAIEGEGENSSEDPLKGKKLVTSLCGKMRQRRIKIVRGDKVKLNLIILNSIENMKCIIIFRL